MSWLTKWFSLPPDPTLSCLDDPVLYTMTPWMRFDSRPWPKDPAWRNRELLKDLAEANKKLEQSYEDFDFILEVDKAAKRTGYSFSIILSRLEISKPKVVVTIRSTVGNRTYVRTGVAKCGDKDVFNISRGLKIALFRAVRALKDEYEAAQIAL